MGITAIKTCSRPSVYCRKIISWILPKNMATFLLAFSMFMTGASGLVSEYILSTVSTYVLGNSVKQFSIIIALMLLMMGIAGWVQKFVSNNNT